MNQKILIIDDEPNVLAALKRILEMKDFDVSVASNIDEAQATLAEEDFDILLVDVIMPGIRGPELVGKLLSEENRPAVFYTSGYGLGQFDEPEIGEQNFVAKPFDFDDLFTRLSQSGEKR